MKIVQSKSLFFIILSVTSIFFTACDPNALNVQREEEENTYRRAKRFKREGRQEEALKSYLKVIANRASAPESHLNAGLLYLEHRRDPISAIYHFNRYLELEPSNDKTQLVRQQIEAAKRLFISNLPGQPYQGEYERLDLMKEIKQLETQNKSLQEQLLVMQQQLASSNAIVTATRIAPSSSTSFQQKKRKETTRNLTTTPSQADSVKSIYVVQKGDTLSSISRQIYNTPSRWMDIYRANKDKLSTPNQLKVGQKLRLP